MHKYPAFVLSKTSRNLDDDCILGSLHILRNHRGGRQVSKMLMHDYGGGGGGGGSGVPYDDMSKNNFFHKMK